MRSRKYDSDFFVSEGILNHPLEASVAKDFDDEKLVEAYGHCTVECATTFNEGEGQIYLANAEVLFEEILRRLASKNVNT